MDELKEIREGLAKGRQAMRDIYKERGFDSAEVNWDRYFSALSRLEAREAEAPKDAHDLVMLARERYPSHTLGWKYSNQDIAAEIEGYVQARIVAEPKTVPIEMLQDARHEGGGLDGANYYSIAKRYGCTISED